MGTVETSTALEPSLLRLSRPHYSGVRDLATTAVQTSLLQRRPSHHGSTRAEGSPSCGGAWSRPQACACTPPPRLFSPPKTASAPINDVSAAGNRGNASGNSAGAAGNSISAPVNSFNPGAVTLNSLP
eukprot:1986090-Rhodomonas_salina.2